MRRLVTRKMPCLGFPNRFSHGVGLQRRPQQPPQKTHTLTTTRATTSAASLSRRWCTIRLFTVKRRIYREPRRHFGVDGLCQLCREEEDGRWPPQRRSVHRHRRVRTPLIVDTVCAAFFGRRRLLQAGTPCPPDILPSPRHALVCFDSDGDVFVFFFLRRHSGFLRSHIWLLGIVPIRSDIFIAFLVQSCVRPVTVSRRVHGKITEKKSVTKRIPSNLIPIHTVVHIRERRL